MCINNAIFVKGLGLSEAFFGRYNR